MSWVGALLDGLFGTAQQYNQNKFNQEEAERNRAFQSSEADKNRNFQAKQAELAYARQEEFYDERLSYAAQVQQMKQAGLNPAMMYGGSASGSGSLPSASVPSGSMPVGDSASATPANILTFFEKALDLEGKDLDNQTKEQNLDLNKRKAELEMSLLQAQEQREYMTIKHMQSDIEVNDNRIKVGNSEFEVNLSQRDLNHAKKVFETMNAKQVESLTPVMVDYYTAETEEARETALLRIAQAGGVEVENRERESNIKLADAQTDLVKSQTSKTETDEKLGTADTIITGVGTALSIGELLLEGVAEVFGFSETLAKFKSNSDFSSEKQVYDKFGNLVRSEQYRSRGSKDKNGSSTKKMNKRVTKKGRRL